MSAPPLLPGQLTTAEDWERIQREYPNILPVFREPCTCIGGWTDGPNDTPVRCSRCRGSPGWVTVERKP
jgi:hypothetical protein